MASDSDSSVNATVSDLPAFSATELASGMSTVTRTVLREGAAVITRHQQPVMVLLSVERYAQLEQAHAPNLERLSERFEQLYRRLQKPGTAERSLRGLDLAAPRAVRHPRGRSARRRA